MSEYLGLIATTLAVTGVLLNNRMNHWGFALWVISNLLCLRLHASAGLGSLAIRDIIFTVLAIEGFVRWSRKQKVK